MWQKRKSERALSVGFSETKTEKQEMPSVIGGRFSFNYPSLFV